MVIENLLPKADEIIIGGGMCYTFLKAQGHQIGNSKLEKDKIDLARDILAQAKKQNVKISLPIDNIVTDKIAEGSKVEIAGENIPEGLIGVDIGPKTIENFCADLKGAQTILWNGPLGIFEIDAFANGTKKVAECVSKLKAITIIGGGDTAAAISKFGLEDKMTHVSTGGGASLEFPGGQGFAGDSRAYGEISVSSAKNCAAHGMDSDCATTVL